MLFLPVCRPITIPRTCARPCAHIQLHNGYFSSRKHLKFTANTGDKYTGIQMYRQTFFSCVQTRHNVTANIYAFDALSISKSICLQLWRNWVYWLSFCSAGARRLIKQCRIEHFETFPWEHLTQNLIKERVMICEWGIRNRCRCSWTLNIYLQKLQNHASWGPLNTSRSYSWTLRL